MTVVAVRRHQFREMMKQITLHIGIIVLVHEDRRGRVRDVYHAYTLTHFRLRDRGAYARCHINSHLALVRADRELLVVDAHGTIIRSQAMRANCAVVGVCSTRRRYFPACGRGATRAPSRPCDCAPLLTPAPRLSMLTCCSRMRSASGGKPCTPIPSVNFPPRRPRASSSSSSGEAAASRWRTCAA